MGRMVFTHIYIYKYSYIYSYMQVSLHLLITGWLALGLETPAVVAVPLL